MKEGKIELVADIDGLLKVNSDKIKKVKTGNKGFHQDVPTEDVVITSVSVE